MFVKKIWATNFTVRERIYTRSYEIMTVSFRPYNLPREFRQVTVILVYVPGPDNAQAAERISECYNRAISRLVEQAVFVLGDFNMCDITGVLPSLHQSVSCPTRLDRFFDLCYSNIPEVFQSLCRPPLGRSDHNVVHLLPKYRQRPKQEKPRIQRVCAGP